MSRVFKIDSPGKIRNQVMRTAAEAIRHLSQKSVLDGEAKDLAALLVYCLRQIAAGVEETARAWEKRDYWVKAERFRQRWAWADRTAADLDNLIRKDAWDMLPGLLADLIPHFISFKVTRFTRKPSLWTGIYARLMAE
jgi:hypothetical protein